MKKKIKSISLIANVIAIIVVSIMLVGSTFAWFTDSAISSGNKIQAGTLKIDLELLDAEQDTWVSLKGSNAPIFDYENWEPGYTDVKVLKVENEGSLALKWKAKFVSNAQLSELANVIDVYVLSSEDTPLAYPTDRNLTEYTLVGTLAEFVNTIETTTFGTLIAGDETYLSVALKMRDGIGNEYQGVDLGGTFDIQIVATQLSSESDGFGDDYDTGAGFPGTGSSMLSGAFKLLNNTDSTIEIVDGEIILSNAGVVQGVLPRANVSIVDNVITITGAGEFDGVYTVHESGYIDKDGEIIAKSEDEWLEVEQDVYFIVHDGLVYTSIDGNTIYTENGEIEPVLNLDQLSGAVNNYIASTGMTIDEFYDAYGYRFNEYNEDEFVVGNLYDFLAVQNIVDKGEYHWWGIYTGRYDYWGGTAKDVKSDDALLCQANWAETDLDAVVTTQVYLVTNEGEKLLSVNDSVEGGTIKVVQETKYYHDGVETENVMFFEDYALYFEDGMTYGEWMRSYFLMELHDMCNGNHDHNGIYIPEEYLDKLCEPGYRYEIQSGLERIYNDYLGYYSNTGAWNMEMIIYSYGKTYIRPTNFNETGYQYVGMSWEGGLQADGSIYADDYYNYFIRNGLTPKSVPFYSAFTAVSDTFVDISSYLTLDASNNVVVNVSGLMEAFDLEGSISVIPVYEKDGYFVDCRSIDCTYSEEIQGNYYHARQEWLSYTTFGNGATGITFYYNGTIYTGFVN